MKKTLLALTVIGTLGALCAGNLSAQSVPQVGDTWLLFHTDGTGSAAQNQFDIGIDLGNTFNGHSFSYNFASSDLSFLASTYGAGYQNASFLQIAVLGSAGSSLQASTNGKRISGNNAQNAAADARNIFSALVRNGVSGTVADSAGTFHYYSILDNTAGGVSFTSYENSGYESTIGALGYNVNDTGDTVLRLYSYSIAAGGTPINPIFNNGTSAVTLGGDGGVTVNTVPEPSTYALCGVAALLVLVAYRRGASRNS